MAFKSIVRLIKDTMGFEAESVGKDVVERGIALRMKECQIESDQEYLSLVKNSDDERQHLINQITVPETWFFRDHEPFHMLSDFVSRVWVHEDGKPLRVLSIPCSTGEEPYTIAMVMAEAGMPEGSFVVDGVDINTGVIECAERGVYTQNSFRADDLAFRDKYFDKQDNSYVLSDEIKSSVSFFHQNVMDYDFMKGRGPYHVVFCRNMLIYFNIENKYKVLKKVHGLMCPDGLLFLGHAETGRIDHKLFDTMKHPGAFAYRWRDPFITAKTEKTATKVKTPQVVSATAFGKNKPFSSNTSSYKEPPPENLATENSSGIECLQENVVEVRELQHIQDIADKGELEKAAENCNDYILANPYSAKGYCLLGVIQLANNDGAAIESFRKALYLDPNHYQSLVHLSILSEEDGNQKAAENYRARAERVGDSHSVN